jgi:cell division protease FtsH
MISNKKRHKHKCLCVVMKQTFFCILSVFTLSLAFLGRQWPHRLKSRLGLSNQKYPFSKKYYENGLKRPNISNTIRDGEIMGIDYETTQIWNEESNNFTNVENVTRSPRIRIMLGRRNSPNGFNINISEFLNMGMGMNDDDTSYENFKQRKQKKSENFEVITDHPVKFNDVGGYDSVKEELQQCIDILSNVTKYTKYNIRTPRGIIFEGPPGNGKTLIAKALAGEAKIAFIPVSGSQFQDKYVGVGSSRIRELFSLASKYTPVIIFIDEIDALGRRRSGEGETAGSERDNTLNELLIAMDGFKNNSGIFVVGATNRADLLDPALLRPGRIDKRIYIGNPDAKTREAILRIHTHGKPYDAKISLSDLVDTTAGLSGAQIENLVNEAMINALRCNREMINKDDIDLIMNKMMVGWQPTEHKFTSDIIDHIAIHEMGHAVLGLFSKHHSKLSKVVINLSSPKSPAYTVFKSSEEPIFTRDALFEHLMILLGGRIAEEVFYNVSVTTGAINDFSEALKLAEKMILDYGMGKSLIYPSKSEKYLTIIDDEITGLIHQAYSESETIIRKYKDFIYDCAELLKRDQIIHADYLEKLIHKYNHLKHTF